MSQEVHAFEAGMLGAPCQRAAGAVGVEAAARWTLAGAQAAGAAAAPGELCRGQQKPCTYPPA